MEEESESSEKFQQLTKIVMEAVTKFEHEDGINELLALSAMKNFQRCLKRVLEELMLKYVKVVSFSWDKLKRRSFCSFLGKLLIISCHSKYSFCVIGNFLLDTLSNWIHQDFLQITTEECEVYVDCLCVLLPLVGEHLEEICPERLEVMFSSVQDVVLDSHLPRFIKRNMLNLLLLRKSHWKHPNKDSKLMNYNREKSCPVVGASEAEKGEDCTDNSKVECGSVLTVDVSVPESGDNFKTASGKAIYEFVGKMLNHLGKASHLSAFVRYGVCDHVILTSSCEDLPSKLKPLRLSDQVIKEITVFMAGFSLAYSSDADNEAFSKLSTVLRNKSGKSQSTKQHSLVTDSSCNLVEHCESIYLQSSEWCTALSTRKPICLKQQLSDPCTVTCSDVKNCELHNSCCLVHPSQSAPKIYDNRWDIESQVPDPLLSTNSSPSNKDQYHRVVNKDVEPPVLLKYQEKNSVSEVDVSFIHKISKQQEVHEKWKEFMSSYKSVQRYRPDF